MHVAPSHASPTDWAAPFDLPAVLDLEASGFGKASYPIEVGFVLPDGSSYCSLIRPPNEWTHWDDAAERVHHISRAQLLRHGRSVADVARALNERLQGRTLYTDGWAHDYPWLARLYDAAGVAPSFRLDNLRSVLTEREAELWHPTKAGLDAELGLQRHRASADARLLQMTLQRLREAPEVPELQTSH